MYHHNAFLIVKVRNVEEHRVHRIFKLIWTGFEPEQILGYSTRVPFKEKVTCTNSTTIKTPFQNFEHFDSKENSFANEPSILDIHKLESVFALKLMAKHMLSEEVVNDVLAFSGKIHSAKIEVVKAHLKRRSSDANIVNICDQIAEIDKISNLDSKMSIENGHTTPIG